VNLLGLEGAIKSADELALRCEQELSFFDEELQKNLKILLSKYLYRHKN
jgi:farnesyl diphosphate synthase